MLWMNIPRYSLAKERGMPREEDFDVLVDKVFLHAYMSVRFL
jgi:hypothetical protein